MPLIFFEKKEGVSRKCPVKKIFLKIWQNSKENTCARMSFLIKLQAPACSVIKKETLVQVFFCKFYKIFKNTFFYRTPLVAAFGKDYFEMLVVSMFNLDHSYGTTCNNLKRALCI